MMARGNNYHYHGSCHNQEPHQQVLPWTAKRLLVLLLLTAASSPRPGLALDNGLARKPPMGWMAWARFACETDCQTYPEDCISESLFRDMADHLEDDGYLAAGYDYINIDDCWAERSRDPVTQQLVADGKRFPSGIASLAKYVHSRGVKMGIYGDIGSLTCAGYPGFSQPNTELTNYFMLDMETFSIWGIDSLKVDGCYADTNSFHYLYPRLGSALNLTGRPILYSCSWPAYQIGANPDYGAIEKNCNLWRNFDDIEDSWQSVLGIIDFYSKNQDLFSTHHGPGGWFDPDMLIIGNFGLSLEQSRAQMALWAMWSAPLLMSNDLRAISDEHRDILQNRHVIAVDQDDLGIMGRRVYSQSSIEIWSKPMAPVINGTYHSFAVVYFNRRTLGSKVWVSQTVTSILNGTDFAHSRASSASSNLAPLYNVYDLFDGGRLLAKLQPQEKLSLMTVDVEVTEASTTVLVVGDDDVGDQLELAAISGVGCRLGLKWPVSPGHGHFLTNTLRENAVFRRNFVVNLLALGDRVRTPKSRHNNVGSNRPSASVALLQINVVENAHCLDYSWNGRLLCLIRLKMELWESLNWMSTLGGAYSCLGDNDKTFAIRAGDMSKFQLKLSSVVGDPNLMVRCAIYKVYSFCQLGRQGDARRLLRKLIYPLLQQMVARKCCDTIVKNMYKAACHRVKYQKSFVCNKKG